MLPPPVIGAIFRRGALLASLALTTATAPAADNESMRAAAIVRQLTLDEKALLLSGRDDWHVGGIERVGLPLMRVSDCGHGVTLAAPPYGSASCLPTSVGMASTWNEALLFEAGELLGRETRAKGCGLLLGPMVNLHRLPLGGRNYETFSEDPLLTGKLAAALIRGVQSTGSGACIKALAGNNQQKDQHTTGVEVDERTLRELYLRGFEIAVHEAQPWAIMTSYNPLNGIQPSENSHLLTDIVRRDWGFGGLLVSDWRAVESVRALNAGLNLEMPGPGKQLNLTNIQAALANGQLTMDQLDLAVTPMVEMLLRYAANTNGPGELDSLRHRDIARRVADESLVLLKNDGLLPLDATRLTSLAVIGPNAAHARLGGGGSASVTPFYAVSPLEGLRRLVGDRVRIEFAEGGGMAGGLPVIPTTCLRTNAAADAPAGLQVEFFDNPLLRGEPCAKRVDANIDFAWGWAAPMNGVPRFHFSARWSGCLIPPVTGKYKLNLVSEQSMLRVWLDGKLLQNGWEDRLETKFEELYSNRALEGTVELKAGQPVPIVIEFSKTGPKTAVRLQWETPDQEDPVEAAARLAAHCDAAVVFVGLANIHEGGNQDRSSYALPGRQVELIRRVAAANPRTAVVLINGSVVSVSEWLKTVPAVLEAWYPGQEGGNAIAAALFGNINPSGRLPDTIFHTANDILALKNYPGNGKRVVYAEGMKVGYRQMRPGDESVVFPFGFGLSYTTFELGNAAFDGGVSVTVTNTGERVGSTVVQVYRQRGQPADDDPWRELAVFRKVQLQPGETQTVRLAMSPEAFCSWSNTDHRWQRDPRLTSLWVTLDARTGKELLLPVAGTSDSPVVPNYDEAKVLPYTLPGLLTLADGAPVLDAAIWRGKRRPELLELFSREVYGRTPAGRPAGMHWAVKSVDRAALGGKAVRKEITIWFTEKMDGPKMHLLIYQPIGAAGAPAPWPVFLGLNFFGNNCINDDPGIALSAAWMRARPEFHVVDSRATEGTRGVQSASWNVEAVLARGYATATAYYGDLCEDRPEGLAKDAGAIFGTLPVKDRKPDEWGAIGIWSWGLSRALDYLQNDPEIDGQRVAVHGHSRLGKAALWAGAQDERFAMVIANDSGEGGAALTRRNYGETTANITSTFPHWYSANYARYVDRAAELPVDAHELIALVAPRPVYIASAEEDKWADPRGEFLAAKSAEDVYRLFGKAGLGVQELPPLNHPIGENIGYHIRTGGHDITRYDWEQFLRFADRQLQPEGSLRLTQRPVQR